MAEALGVAASGISIAQVTSQVGVVVVKLKKFCDEVKDVPDDIADLLQQIDCLDPALWEAENSFESTGLPAMLWNDAAAKRSTTYCRNALKSLTEIVDEMAVQINHSKRLNRKVASMKVALRKDTLKKLEKRLENAVRMLTLAQQSYLTALTRIQPDIIVQKFTTLVAHLQPSHARTSSGVIQPCDASDNDNPQAKQPSRSKAIQLKTSRERWRQQAAELSPFGRFVASSFEGGCSLVLQAPWWLSQRSWEFQSYKANSGWRINLRTYSARPEESEVFKVAKNGVPHDLQRMFDMGLASPFDYDSAFGRTLLHVALQTNNLAIVLYLLGKGLDLWAEDHYGIAWVGSLKAAGINVTGYGRREMELLRDATLTRDFVPCQETYRVGPWRSPDPVWRGVSIRLMGYKYGPEPEDWDVYWSEPTDEFAGDFWELVENPPLQVPGTWDPSFDDDADWDSSSNED
ncbi:hypothetical protein DL764_003401 [Monosporascus ibericus]|uniref:Uncharacterized protein n=1 Tax=Monosporascus ibericus TaxID=155417 RepID=A0A4Q4THD6_9PEZI|nr:hypothetical protein DL764_003401 [Monosporascus ibericus]